MPSKTRRHECTYNFFSFFKLVNSPVGIVWIRLWFNFSSFSCVSVSNERRSSRSISLLFRFLCNLNKNANRNQYFRHIWDLRFCYSWRLFRRTYIFCRTFPLKNVLGAMAWIKLRLKSKWMSCGSAISDSDEISWISLLANSSVFNDTKPTNNGTRVSLFWFKRKANKFFRFRMDVAQRSSSKILWDNSL